MAKKVNTQASKNISIKGARLHNLKNISVDIPRNRLTVVTGVSGSGKSSLAFDTLYAEGQRRFVESLSSYARQFLERMHKPEVDSISGLPPAIAIEQHTPQKNPRSTVGTTTEIYDYLRLLYGRIGTTFCRLSGLEVKKDTPQSVVEALLALEEGTKLYVLFALPDNAKDKASELEKLVDLGFYRLYFETKDEIAEIDKGSIDKKLMKENFLILSDRLIVRHDEETKSRLTDSIESAMKNGGGRIEVRNLSGGQVMKFSSLYECNVSGRQYVEPEPKLFAFNTPFGACPNCQGFGRSIGIDEDLVIPDRSVSIRRGAIAPFKGEQHSLYLEDLIDIAEEYGIPLDIPIGQLTKKQADIIWNGAGSYAGINGFFKMIEEKSYKVQHRVLMSRYRGYTVCQACEGSRLRTSARQVFIGGMNIPRLVKMPLKDVHAFIKNLKPDNYQAEVAGTVISEIVWRLELLIDIGLEYLTLDRLSHTLSGGEAQRISLSTALGSSLVGTLYVLDEPSIGLHARDTQKLISILFKLRNLGNTIVVVEHDPDVITEADMIIDMGPKAGEHGGEIMFAGTKEEILKSKTSLTGKYLTGRLSIKAPQKRRPGNGKELVVHGARENNLDISELRIPLGCLTLVTGVSGSGKSTLVHDILYGGLMKIQGGYNGFVGKFEKISGHYQVRNIEMVDQSPIGRSTRSTPATYTKVFDLIRDVFANTQEAKQLGWKAGYFSFNVPGGRCDVCEGEGVVTVDMQFLPNVTLECEACSGTRYKKEVRNLLHNGKSIVDVLDMTIDEAMTFFKSSTKIVNKLKVLSDVGLGYLKLGQSSSNLSGGEAQRIKLAGHLDSNMNDETLFIFDEPTTGLHLDDIAKLLLCFNKLVDAGHTLVIIEHNLHVISTADWIIDLGPEAGENGGKVVAQGTPDKIMKAKNSLTGKCLKEFLEKQ